MSFALSLWTERVHDKEPRLAQSNAPRDFILKPRISTQKHELRIGHLSKFCSAEMNTRERAESFNIPVRKLTETKFEV
jgi:hypothetical protein